MKLLILPLLLALVVTSNAHALRMARCGSDRHYTYYCSPIMSGYIKGKMVWNKNNASVTGVTCNGSRFTPWLRLRRGVTGLWGESYCWYWLIRNPR